MADDTTQRSFRLSDRSARAPASGANDPLAELARLIGQNDPFGEYGREPGRGVPPGSTVVARNPEPQPAADWSMPPPPAQPPRVTPPVMQPVYAEESLEHPYAGHDPAYDHLAADPNMAAFEGEHQVYYEDEPPRRRTGIIVLAAVFALAVIGAAGAFGYRALFGTPGASPPKTITADPSPIKVPPPNKDAKVIQERAPAAAEKLGPPPEPPVDVNKPGAVVLGQANPPAGVAPPPGSGLVGTEPKKIHTIVIRPDQMAAADPNAPPPAIAANAAPLVNPSAAAPPPAPRAAPAGDPPPAAVRAAPQQRVVAAAPTDGAPLSLSPDAQPAPQARPAPPMRAASVPPAAAAPPPAARTNATNGGFAVQLSARRSEAEAQAAFREMQTKFPGQLAGHQPLIRHVEIPGKGAYYRAMVGPYGSSDEAGKVCAALKAAGGSCFVQRI